MGSEDVYKRQSPNNPVQSRAPRSRTSRGASPGPPTRPRSASSSRVASPLSPRTSRPARPAARPPSSPSTPSSGTSRDLPTTRTRATHRPPRRSTSPSSASPSSRDDARAVRRIDRRSMMIHGRTSPRARRPSRARRGRTRASRDIARATRGARDVSRPCLRRAVRFIRFRCRFQFDSRHTSSRGRTGDAARRASVKARARVHRRRPRRTASANRSRWTNARPMTTTRSISILSRIDDDDDDAWTSARRRRRGARTGRTRARERCRPPTTRFDR